MTSATAQLAGRELQLSGTLDKETVPELLHNTPPLAEGESYQLNLEQLQKVDSAGLAYIVNLICQHRQTNGTIQITSLTEQLQDLVTLTETDMLLQPDADSTN